ncbi:MAG TPA: FAD synthetase family protein, partial [Candidatus Limnocylindria bacterium]|nr:FAD synthetase family protein [Candidatus Limnocylindria bacterium]
MRVYHLDDLTERLGTPTAVCLGVFDGVHVGHRRLIAEAVRVAGEKGLEALAHTYDPLPMRVIHPNAPACDLTPVDLRLRLFEGAGAQSAAVSRFDDALMHMPGREFFERVLLDKLNARHIVVGFNHAFGYHADTHTEKLRELCREHGVGLSVIPPVRLDDGRLVSSSAIRAALLRGDLDEAREMLGREPEPELL